MQRTLQLRFLFALSDLALSQERRHPIWKFKVVSPAEARAASASITHRLSLRGEAQPSRPDTEGTENIENPFMSFLRALRDLCVSAA
jgi:hypothetical protein